MRIRLRLLRLAAAAALVAAGAASAAPAEVTVFFTRGEQFAPVERPIGDSTPLDAAVGALFAGPTDAERARGLSTNVPEEATARAVALSAGVATIDVSAAFGVGPRASLHARLGQLVFTATAVAGVERVRLTVDGVPVARFGGLLIADGVGRDAFAPTPAGGAPPPPPPLEYSRAVERVQERLVALRYLPRGAADGLLGTQTRHAILAFQGWEELPRDGRVTARLLARLRSAEAPRPRTGTGRRIEVSIARQVALLVEDGRLARAIHVSTGARNSETPRGSFRVFRKELRSWSYPYRVWLPYASYFTGGVAFHEWRDVPPYPASHGCVRVPATDAPLVYGFASIGTRVVVY